MLFRIRWKLIVLWWPIVIWFQIIRSFGRAVFMDSYEFPRAVSLRGDATRTTSNMNSSCLSIISVLVLFLILLFVLIFVGGERVCLPAVLRYSF